MVPTPTITLAWASLTPVSAPTYSTPTATGYPLANGSLADCFQVFDNSHGSLACWVVADMFGVSVWDWVLWNPSVLEAAGGSYSSDTCFLANETEYCGSFYDQSLVLTTDAASAFLPAPTDATAGATTQCLEWYQTGEGDTCDSIYQMADIPYSSLYAWNPALGNDCQHLWLETDYCVAGPGWSTVSYGMVTASATSTLTTATTTTRATSTPTSTSSSATTMPSTTTTSTKTSSSTTVTTTTSSTGPNGIATPLPIQSGMASNCIKFVRINQGDTCDVVSFFNGPISTGDFVVWNSGVGASCNNLQPNCRQRHRNAATNPDQHGH